MDFQLFQNAMYPLLLKSISLNIAFNQIKTIYSENIDKEPTAHIIRLCCVIKPLITWNLRDVATRAVERCGGQGYLSVNRLAENIGFAHSGITAEGDNSVLMQKVAKELMTSLEEKNFTFPPMTQCPMRELAGLKNVNEIETLLNLIKWREVNAAKDMTTLQIQKVRKEGKSVYDVWMKEGNYQVQALAFAFGERVVAEFCVNELRICPSEIRKILEIIVKGYLEQTVIENLAWYLMHNYISVEAAENLKTDYRKILEEVHKNSLKIVNSFGIPEHLLTAPIAQDYEDFNSRPNGGEVYRPNL